MLDAVVVGVVVVGVVDGVVVPVVVAVEVPDDVRVVVGDVVGVVISQSANVPSKNASVALLIAEANNRHAAPVFAVLPWPSALIMSSISQVTSLVTSPIVYSVTIPFNVC